jgi:hypothetical protein
LWMIPLSYLPLDWNKNECVWQIFSSGTQVKVYFVTHYGERFVKEDCYFSVYFHNLVLNTHIAGIT